MRLAVLQRVCPSYRLTLFQELFTIPGLTARLFIGEDIPNTKVRSAPDLSGIDSVKLPTRFIRLGGRVLPWHRGLISALEEFQPDVILCEGESNFLSYMQAIRYRRRHQAVGLVHWGGGGLPGVPLRPRGLKSRGRFFFQKKFDALLVYSGFSKVHLVRMGHDPEKVIVATNVTDTASHLKKAAATPAVPTEARSTLGLPDRFTVLFVGELDANKRPDLLLDLADATNPEDYNFVLLGDGAMLEPLRERVRRSGLSNVLLPGRVGAELPLYYRASDVMILPGRGGMVISEAMAWSVPVLVHEADGTEYDLVRDGETGRRLEQGDVNSFLEALEGMRTESGNSREWGRNGHELLVTNFTMDKMIEEMGAAIRMAAGAKRSGF